MAKTTTFNGVKDFIYGYYRRSLHSVAKELGYNEDNIAILEGNYDKVSQNTKNNLKSCINQRDSRTELEFAKDLVAGWIFEDVVKNFLSFSLHSNGYTVSLGGSDKKRKILKSKNVKYTPDFIVEKDGKKVGVEMISNFTDYWFRTNKIDIRCNKFNELKNNNSLVIAISASNHKFTLFNPNNCSSTYTDYHHSWYKPAYTINTDSIPFTDFTNDNVIKYFKEIF